MDAGLYDDLIELAKTAMKDPENWTIRDLKVRYHLPNTDSFARFVKGHKQIGYTNQELVDKVVLMLRRSMIELVRNEE